MDEPFLHQLLLEGEGPRLDYKEKQYKIANATDSQKAEFIKDILAMANAWRSNDAFILTGVRERPGQCAEIVGVQTHLDDASLQQLVTGKTNRPAIFSYNEMNVDGKSVGIIQIPVQKRPLFPRERFVQLDARAVYVRRGSSTAIADPDEVHRMGEAIALAQAGPLDKERMEAVRRQYESVWPAAKWAIRDLLIAGELTDYQLNAHFNPKAPRDNNILQRLVVTNMVQRAERISAREEGVSGYQGPYRINPDWKSALEWIVKADPLFRAS